MLKQLRFTYSHLSNRKARLHFISDGQAFSMIELILVMMLIGVLSVIIVPKADNLITTMRLKAAGAKLQDDLTFIYDYAVTKHDTTWLVVNIAENSYGIFSGPSESERELILDPSTNRQGYIDFDDEYSGVQVTSVNFNGGVTFYYNWWGTPSSGGEIVLNNSKIIKVVPETGYVYETE
jgi:prepilin-type N-terminal cleavage/methylation domain-containing protein